jgi:hypothetical protein
MLSLPPLILLGGRLMCCIAIHFDIFLDAVGKELGKVNCTAAPEVPYRVLQN